MKKRLLRFSMLALVLGFTTANAQLYNYTTDLSGVPSSVAANTTGSNLSQVNGATSIIGCPDGFNSNKFSESTIFAVTRPAMEFSITPNSGFQLDVTTLSVDARRSNKGPVTWRMAYSTDGGASWIDNGADLNVTAYQCSDATNLVWDMTDFSTYNMLLVRIYAYAAVSNLNGIATAKNIILNGAVSYADVDGDGYTSDVDCNDADVNINPGITEVCNGIDDNCDGNIDEGVQTTYFADTDADGYGDAGNTTMACSLPEGFVENDADCNDADANINPDATEVCNGVDDNCDGNIDEGLTFTTYYADADGDSYGDAASTATTCDGVPEGYVADNTDCNDADMNVNPGATEICNGVDDNCDGNVDEGVESTFYADADGDGYGDASSTTLACSAPEGYVADATDCNDADMNVNPGATEICNGVDDNCDGNVDEGVESTFYADADGDGYGDASSTTMACSAPEGYVADNTDCNDADMNVNPGATEICNGVDDNCDGNIDEGVLITFFADADGDGFGDGASTTTACSAPEGYVADNTDCNDADMDVNPGAAEVCNGVDDNCDGNIDEGVETTFYADADGDGYGDASSTTMACSAPEGYVADATDCNDGDMDVNPGAAEVCNGVDDNCDGNIDEGLTFTTYYADADDDSYGDAASTATTCDGVPEGYVADNTDCNDADMNVNPGATEICNGVDDNCDGNVDEGVESTFYADADGDGYGDASSTTLACSAPEGYVADATDCNDADMNVNPGATEICNGVDDNCDGNIDEGVLITFFADADGDGFGDGASTTTACSAPEGFVGNSDDCNDASDIVYPGAPEICDNGIDEDCDGAVDVISTIEADGPTTFCVGNTVTLTCTTGGTGLSYQWLKNGSNIIGANDPTLTVSLQGNYKCTISKPSCTSTSAVITVSVNLVPNAVIGAPDGTDLCGLSNVRLKGSNGPSLSYQWYLNGEAISGATSNIYYATSVGDYQVQTTTAAGCSNLSAITTVTSSCRVGFASTGSIQVMPNPSEGNFELAVNLAVNNNGNAAISIYNLAGQLVAITSAEVVNGQFVKAISIPQVAGMYMVVTEFEGLHQSTQIVISE